MSDEPKSFWKRPVKWFGLILSWLGLMMATAILFAVISLIFGSPFRRLSDWGELLTSSLVIATMALACWLFIRWLCCWKNFRRFLFGLACLITLIALIYAEEDFRAWHAWNQFKHEWEAKGEKFAYKDFILPPVPDNENFAMAPMWVNSIESEFGTNVAKKWYGVDLTEKQRAGLPDPLKLSVVAEEDWNHWPTNGNWAKGTETDLTGWQQYYRNLAARTNLFPVRPQSQSPAADVLFALSKYDSAIEQLQRISALPYSRFPVFSNTNDPFSTLLPHLAVLKRCAQTLELRAVAELQNGQTEAAADDVVLAVQLNEKIHNEPFLISHLVRIAMLQLALQPVYEGLAEHKWSDAQLEKINSELAKMNFLADYEFSMRGERASCLTTIDYIRRTHDFGFMDGKRSRIASLVPGAFFYQNELTIARLHQQYALPMVSIKDGSLSPKSVQKNQAAMNRELNRRFWPYKIFARMLLPAVENAVKKFAYAQSATDLARVAIALERYRLANGFYPDSLDAIAGQFPNGVPHDVIGGKPLNYRRTEDGQFVLYSVGWNERDDGGALVFKKQRNSRDESSSQLDLNQGDWVWRYPKK